MNPSKAKIGTKLKRPKRLSDEVAEILRKKIDTAVYKPGEKLPPESKLAESFGVSRTVIREALARIKSDGLLDTRQGKGAIISDSSQRNVFRFGSKKEDDPNSLEHLYELRAILEKGSAALAALRRDQNQLKQMGHCLEQMRKAVLTKTDGSEPDLQFHQLIVKMTNNPDLIDLMSFLNLKLVDQIRKARKNSKLQEGLPFLVEKEHAAIYEAIAAGDPDAARKAATEHITQASLRLGLNILKKK